MNFFAYRLPGESEFTACSSENTAGEDLGKDCFIAVPFDGDRAASIAIPADNKLSLKDIDKIAREDRSRYEFPDQSTTEEEHRESVKRILSSIDAGEISKGVIARALIREARWKLSDMLAELDRRYPEAFIFCFHTPESGTWIGASPETLLEKRGGNLATMALAGTRPAGSSGEWDRKNIREQAIVREFIVDTLETAGYKTETTPISTQNAGPVEHLMNRIRISAEGEIDGNAIARLLSPTPALCGMPRGKAMRRIREAEKFERGYYGGYCGPRFADGDFRYFVNLRSMRLSGGKAALFAGGGIVKGSEPEKEWLETEKKFETTLNTKVWE